MRRDVRSASKAGERALFGVLTTLGLAAVVAPGLVLRFGPPCLFDLAGFDHCWGCGMTRAIVACLRAQFGSAWDANPRVFIVLPLLLVEYLRFGWRLYGARLAMPVTLKP